MRPAERGERIATLWRLTGDGATIACLVYRMSDGFELSVESAAATIVREPFMLEPRALSRAEALRQSLRRRGWQEAPASSDDAASTRVDPEDAGNGV
jgi:hypothetical protein